MKLFVSILCVSCLLSGIMASPAYADDIADLKAMIEQMKKEHQEQIQQLEAKINRLEAQQDGKVEQKVAQMREEIKEEIKSTSIAVDYVGRRNAPAGNGGLLLSNPSGFGNVSLGGYFDMEFVDRDDEDSTFRQHRWIINIGAQPHERIRFASEFELEYGGPNVPNSDGEAKVEQAYMDYLINDVVNFRAGALLAPFGRYNLYHDSDLQDLTDRPILAKDVIPTTWTEAGYGLFGEFNPAIGEYKDLEINYEMYVVNGLDSNFSDTGLSGARGSLKTDNNNNKAFVGRLAVSPAVGHEVGVSGYRGAYNNDGDNIAGIGFDTFNTFGPLELISEYAYFGVEEDHATADLAHYFRGAYIQANYHFWFEGLNATFLGRGFKDPTFTLVGRYDWVEIHDDSDTTTGSNEETRYTIGLNYRPIESAVFKLEYQINDKTNETLEAGDNNAIVGSVALGF